MREENWCRIATLFCIPGSAAMVSKFGFASAQNVGTSESHDMFFPNSGIAHAALLIVFFSDGRCCMMKRVVVFLESSLFTPQKQL